MTQPPSYFKVVVEEDCLFPLGAAVDHGLGVLKSTLGAWRAASEAAK